MNVKCSRCNIYWNVSVYAIIPKTGYLCPVCRREIKNSKEERGEQSDGTKNNGSKGKN